MVLVFSLWGTGYETLKKIAGEIQRRSRTIEWVAHCSIRDSANNASKCRPIERVAQKLAPFLYAFTLPNINRFSKLFYRQNQEKICNNTITKDPTAPQLCRYTTL